MITGPHGYISFLMGADAIADDELTSLGVEILRDAGSPFRNLLIPERSLSAYKALRTKAAVVIVCSALGIHTGEVYARACVGDCQRDGNVRVDELALAVMLALGRETVACSAADVDADGTILVHELVAAVQTALNGCPPATACVESLRPADRWYTHVGFCDSLSVLAAHDCCWSITPIQGLLLSIEPRYGCGAEEVHYCANAPPITFSATYTRVDIGGRTFSIQQEGQWTQTPTSTAIQTSATATPTPP